MRMQIFLFFVAPVSFLCTQETTTMEGNTTFPSLSANSNNCSRDNVLKTVVFPVLYSVLFLLSLSLNVVAAWVFFSIPSKSHFIIYLKNIVVADIVMTLTFPFKV